MLLCQLDGIPKALKLFDQSPLLFLLIVMNEGVFSFLLVGLGSGQHVVVDYQDAVPHRHRRTFDAAAFREATILRPKTRCAWSFPRHGQLAPGWSWRSGCPCGCVHAALMVQFMALTMTTVGGTCYPFATVKGWLEQAGMHDVRRHRLLTPGATMITAQKV